VTAGISSGPRTGGRSGARGPAEYGSAWQWEEDRQSVL